jgi:quercetin dioxygenase-like cupin family protein
MMHVEQESGKALFAAFEQGGLALPGRTVAFAGQVWNPSPKFAGVALKHLLTAADTGGMFSYHLVRIAPGMSIGDHVHPTQLETHEIIFGEGVCQNAGVDIAYRPGILSVIEAGVAHAVHAGDKGLLLFAKFMPALC